ARRRRRRNWIAGWRGSSGDRRDRRRHARGYQQQGQLKSVTVFAPTTVSNATGKAWAGGKAADALCGMTVDPAAAAAHAGYDGEAYYFCRSGCRNRFAADAAASPRSIPAADPWPLP